MVEHFYASKKSKEEIIRDYFVFKKLLRMCIFFFFFRAAPMTYGSYQARG